MSRSPAREILALAVPALGALLIEPSLLMVDAAVVGHWSTEALAGLGIAQTVLSTVVGLCIFLAYSTTAAAARALGAGHLDRAVKSGVDAIWLALVIGVGTMVVLLVGSGWIVSWFGPEPGAGVQAVAYLQVSGVGVPAMLVIQAATGIIRGLQDTRTPLYVSAVGALLNAPLSIWLTLGLGWGVRGAAVATVVCQLGMGAALAWIVIAHARRLGVPVRPDWSGVSSSWQEGASLLVRTIMLRAAVVCMLVAVTGAGTVALAAHQVVQTMWGFFSCALDSLAIAGQAMTGLSLGRGEVARARTITVRIIRWSVLSGVAAAVVIGAVFLVSPQVFTPDEAVRHAIRLTLVVVLVGQPVAGVVYALDGVLMGAGDARRLAWIQAGALVAYLPVIVAVGVWGPSGATGLLTVWAAWCLWYMPARGVLLWWRFAGDGWARVGV